MCRIKLLLLLSVIVSFPTSSRGDVPPPLFSKGEVVFNGKQLGTPGSLRNDGNVIANLLDANSWTRWDSPDNTGTDWAGVDAGIATNPTRVRISVRGGYEDWSVGGRIQASNDATFATGTATLLTIGSRPITGTHLNEYALISGNYYRYYRYLTPSGAPGGIADLEFVGKYRPGVVGQACPVIINPPGGLYDQPVRVRLSSLTSDATLYYTLDGSTPTTSSMPYAGPIVIGSNRTLRAIAVSPDLTNSRVTSGAFYVPGTIVSTDQLNETTRGGYRLWAVAGTISYDPNSGKWYWYGYSEDQVGVYTEGGIGLNIYSSADLRNWKFETVVLQAASQNGSQPYFGDRARMLYNAANNNYVLWARQAFAAILNVYAAPSPTGPFTQQNSFSTLDGFGTNGDFNLFQDTDGSAYLIRSGSTNNGILIISKLNSDYTNSDGVNHVNYTNDATSPFGQKSEGHTMFKRGSTYFWMASGYTIWTPNANMYVTSSGPLGPWSAAANPFQPNSDPKSAGPLNYTPSNQFSYDTQNDMAIQIPGRTDGWIYFGDRYDLPHPSLGTDATGDFHLWRPIRLPITFPTSSTMSINWNNAWSFDSAFPSVSGPAQAIDLRASILGASAVLAWQNNEPKAADIYLDRATDPEFTQNVVAEVLPQGTTSFTDSLIQPGLKYFYRVRTVNASGSSFSSTAATGSGRPATFRPSRKRRKYNHYPHYLPNGSLRKKYEKRRRLAQCA